MLTYFVHYEIDIHYEEVVTEAIFEFLVLPCQNATQLVTNVTTANSLQNDFFRVKTVFDYEAICFRTDRSFQHFQFSASCHVQKSMPSIPSVQFLSLEEELSILRSDKFTIDHHLYLQSTDLSRLPPEKVDIRFLYKENKPLIQFLKDLNEMIYQLMTYRLGVATPGVATPGVATPGVATPGVATPPAKAIEILENPEGVYQDYSHLMLGLLRYNGIPCRYVSGYLHQGQDFVGSAQMHAWIEAYIPKAGWVGFDPTHNRVVDEHYIKVADGLDYEDCRPLKEFLHTNSLNRTRSAIKVIEQQQQ